MMKFRRICALVLSLSVAAAGFCGCGSKEEAATGPSAGFNKEGYPIMNEKTDLKVMGCTNGTLPDDWNDLYAFKKMEEMTNLHLNFTLYSSVNYNEKKNLAFASGDLPDFFFKGSISTEDETSYGAYGTLVDLKPYLIYAPNVRKTFEDYPEVEPSVTMDDGKIIVLPEINDVPRDRATKMWINKQWLDKLGLAEPQTTDELYEVLKKFKTGDPNGNGAADEIPISFCATDQLRMMLGAFGLLYPLYAENGKVIYSPADERHKDGLNFFTKLFKEKLLDDQCFTQTFDKMASKSSGEKATLGCFINSGAGSVVGADNAGQYDILTPLQSKEGGRVWRANNVFLKGAFAMTEKNPHKEATIRYIDYLYSEEGGRLMRYGIEGETYKFLDNGLWTYILPEGMTATEFVSSISPSSGAATPIRQPSEFLAKTSHEGTIRLNKQSEKLAPYLTVPYPSVYYSDAEQKKINALRTDLDNCAEEFTARVITGEANIDEEWSGYIAKLEKIGLKEYTELSQKKYDEYQKKMKK